MKYVKKERLYNLEYKEAEITDKIKNSKNLEIYKSVCMLGFCPNAMKEQR